MSVPLPLPVLDESQELKQKQYRLAADEQQACGRYSYTASCRELNRVESVSERRSCSAEHLLLCSQ